ncbi:MAG: hypothetical protein ACRC7O_12765, partial [Fimbriiglobus sp.]
AGGSPQVGRVNLNAIQHPSVLRALFDPNPSNAFTDADVTEYWTRFGTTTGARLARTHAATPSSSAPYIGLAGSTDIGQSVLRYENPADPRSVLFYSQTAAGPAADHVYARTEPLKKIWNNAATTSDTFLVLMTVGFFEVRQQDANGRVYLGKELFQDAPGDLRVKYAAVIDRSHLALATRLDGSVDLTGPGGKPQQATEQPWFTVSHSDVPATTLTTFDNLVIDGRFLPADPMAMPPTVDRVQVFANGAAQEIIPADTTKNRIRIGFGGATLNQGEGAAYTVSLVSGTDLGGQPLPNGRARLSITSPAGTIRYHPAGSAVSNVLLGNPGPQPNFRYDEPRYQGVVILKPTKID